MIGNLTRQAPENDPAMHTAAILVVASPLAAPAIKDAPKDQGTVGEWEKRRHHFAFAADSFPRPPPRGGAMIDGAECESTSRIARTWR
jgi:hypothetical protein